MIHSNTPKLLGLISLACCVIGTIAQVRAGKLRGTITILMLIGLAMWAIGLAWSFAGS